VEPGVLTARDIADAQTAFGLDLMRQVCEPGGNLLLSPTSAASALGLLHPAADPATAAGFSEVLHLPEWSDALVAALHEHTEALDRLRYDGDLDAEDAPDSLRTSNRLWTTVGAEPEQGYLDDVATAFDAEVGALDFGGDPAGATVRINEAVEDDTRGMIERLFESPWTRTPPRCHQRHPPGGPVGDPVPPHRTGPVHESLRDVDRRHDERRKGSGP
jgi:serpin B